MVKPSTKYTKSGRINIAYQVLGEGPIDIVYIPGWVSNIDMMWECPQLVNFLQGLNKFARVILFDKRGTGLSDRMIELSSIEERMDDIRAVMDAVGSKRAALFGHSEGGSASALFAATYPERTLALITFGVFAKRLFHKDYPWAPTSEERQGVYEMIETSWGSGDMDLVSLAPSMGDDDEFMDWLARYFRSGASPSAALALTKMNTDVDIIDILDTIEVPTLLMCRTHDIDVKVEESKFMAERIKGSRFVEFDGSDHLFWAGDTDEVLDEITHFVTQIQVEDHIDRRLATILSSQIDNSDYHRDRLGYHSWQELMNDYGDTVKGIVQQYRGDITKLYSERLTATFDVPSKAVHCAIDIRIAIQKMGLKMSQAIHTGECIFKDNHVVSGLAMHISSGVMDHASANDIILTQTVKNLLSGTGLEFRDHGKKRLIGIEQEIGLLSIKDQDAEDDADQPQKLENRPSTKNHSFLENVL